MSEMCVNTKVVRALMELKGVDSSTLAKMLYVRPSGLNSWLYQDSQDAPLEIDAQLEALRFLGIRGDHPRSDVVHYWRLREPLFSRPSRVYEPLMYVLEAFGPAQAAFVAAEEDPMINTKACAHFALRFPTFLAILEISAHPLRNIHFGPELLPNLSWMPDSFGILLTTEQYQRLEPGAIRVPAMREYLEYSAEMRRWEGLRKLAHQKGLSAEKMASILLNYDPNMALTATPTKLTPSPGEQLREVAEVDKSTSAQETPSVHETPTKPSEASLRAHAIPAHERQTRKRKHLGDLSELGLVTMKR